MVTKIELQGNWDEQKVKLKQMFPVLTDSDLKFAPGKKEEMLQNIQLKLGKPRPVLYKIIEAL